MCVVIETPNLIDEFNIHLFEKISRDVDEFMKATNEEDELQIILRGHLYIEHEIEKLLRNYLVEPKYVLGSRSMFMNKLNLATALGLISVSKRNSYKKLNDLRNAYAHELNYKMTEEDLNKLVDSMDEDLNGDVFNKEWNEKKEMSDEKRTLLKLKRFMLSLWVYVSQQVYKLSLDEYHKRIKEIKSSYMEPDNNKITEQHEAERMRLIEKLRSDLGMTEHLS